jgi:IS5 family transposase
VGGGLAGGAAGAACGAWQGDEVLDDDRFMAPFRSRLTATIGRPTVPAETYLRLMYLKHRYGLGYETLCKEVADSLITSPT